jgi:hypothetical protein
MNKVSMTAGCILAILVVVISSGSYSIIQVNAQVVNRIQEAQLGGTECENLLAMWDNAYVRGEDTTAIQKEFTDKDCWTKLAQLNNQTLASPEPPIVISNQTLSNQTLR